MLLLKRYTQRRFFLPCAPVLQLGANRLNLLHLHLYFHLQWKS